MKAAELNLIPKDHELYRDLTKEKGPVVYVVKGIRRDETPGTKRQWIIPGKNVPCYDIVSDSEGNIFHIAFFEKIDPKGEAQLTSSIDFGVSNMGRIVLDPKKPTPRALKMYQFLEICNRNESNPNRDTRKEAIFYRENKADEAKNKVSNIKRKLEVQTALLSMNQQNLSALAVALGTPELQGIAGDQLTERLLTYSETFPDVVLKAIEEGMTDIISVLKESSQLGILEFSKKDANFRYKGQEILKFQNVINVKPYSLLSKHLRDNEPDMLQEITNVLKTKKMEIEQKEQEKNKL